MTKPTFGEWLAECLPPHPVLNIGGSYFNRAVAAEACRSLERTAWKAAIDGESVTILERLAIEILISVAGFKSVREAVEAYRSGE